VVDQISGNRPLATLPQTAPKLPETPQQTTPPPAGLASDSLAIVNLPQQSEAKLVDLSSQSDKTKSFKKTVGGAITFAGLASGIGYLNTVSAAASGNKLALGLALTTAVPAIGISMMQDKSTPEIAKNSVEAFVGIGGFAAGITLLNSIPAINTPPLKLALGIGMLIGGPALALASHNLIDIEK